MNDTLPEIERMVREKIMARSGEERFVMGAKMFDAAKEMLCASFPPDLPEPERKNRLFERLYGKSRKLQPTSHGPANPTTGASALDPVDKGHQKV